MTFERLFPTPARVTAAELIEHLEPANPAPVDRPYVLVNFVTTLDGRAAFQGRSGALGDDGDRALFRALRERVDAVLAGARTMATERYGRMLSDPQARARRQHAGRSAEPLAVTVSGSGMLSLAIPLFEQPAATVVVFSPVAPDADAVAARVHHVPYARDAADPLSGALAVLRERFEVGLLLCEGGPSLFGALLRERLVDELFLTLAPKLAGGDSGPALSGGPPLPELAELRLVWLLRREDVLYARYALTRER